jgi:hypothetical protein
MQFIRNSDNPNAIAGVFLLVLMAIFLGPTTLPNLLANTLPGVDVITQCAWLRPSAGRAQHQSLIGRASQNPIELQVRTTAFPNPLTADSTLTVTIIVINRSIGTVPLLFNPNTVRIGDDNTSGLGINFQPDVLRLPTNRQDSGSFPETDIRMLGPRQRCKVDITLSAAQLQQAASALGTGSAAVSAYYRVNTPGQSIATAGVIIYPDQGFDVTFIQSEAIVIPLAAGQ